MANTKPPLPGPVGTEQAVTVPQGHNLLAIRLKEHSWVAVAGGDGEIASNRTTDPGVGFSLPPGSYLVRTDGKIEKATTEARELPASPFSSSGQVPPALLRLTAEAPKRHEVDGMAQIAADGTASCLLRVEKLALDGKPLTGPENQDEIFLRTTGGALLDEKGKNRVRSLKLKAGQASFRLASEKSGRVVTVSVLARQPIVAGAEIDIEFVDQGP